MVSPALDSDYDISAVSLGEGSGSVHIEFQAESFHEFLYVSGYRRFVS